MTGMSVHTLRFYESRGLLPPVARSDAGYRSYGDEEIRRLRLVHGARVLGIPLPEVMTLVEGIHEATCGDYATRLLALVDRQRDEVDRRIEELQRIRSELDALAADATTAVGSTQTVAGCTCCLLMDEGGDQQYCEPASNVPTARFSGEMLDVLDLLQCDIGARPMAPTPDDLAPYFLGAATGAGALVARFVPAAASALRQFVAAEQVCCAGLGWHVTDEADAVVLAIRGTPAQVEALASVWQTPEPAR